MHTPTPLSSLQIGLYYSSSQQRSSLENRFQSQRMVRLPRRKRKIGSVSFSEPPSSLCSEYYGSVSLMRTHAVKLSRWYRLPPKIVWLWVRMQDVDETCWGNYFLSPGSLAFVILPGLLDCYYELFSLNVTELWPNLIFVDHFTTVVHTPQSNITFSWHKSIQCAEYFT